MEFRQLEAFVQVVKQGSFSAAASRLYLTQPTISAHIAALEQEMGVPLIVRSARKAYPTETGQTLYEYALELIALREKALAACTSASPKMEGVVTIAASTVPYQSALPELMSRFRAMHPGIAFQVSSGDSGQVVQSILAGYSDLGMTGTSPESRKCTWQPFMDDQLVVMIPNTVQYREITRIRAEDLPRYPLIVREPGSGTRKEMEAHLISKGVAPDSLKIVAQLDDPDAIKRSVKQGLGISILSRLTALEAEAQGWIRLLPLGDEPIRRKLYLVWHKSRQLPLAARSFAQFVLEAREETAPAQPADE